ncbi:hypothetical protein [Legionella longbeachae]|uniref:hypothetical protein n=1 Tax=Legionella longbeachae TaxID=450 RepID=UPI0012485C8E|nr:hypothetical protein [Legionella longbeachae]QEY51106.1 hypothetical protein FQU71_07465 [Legionella longbeachae]
MAFILQIDCSLSILETHGTSAWVHNNVVKHYLITAYYAHQKNYTHILLPISQGYAVGRQLRRLGVVIELRSTNL